MARDDIRKALEMARDGRYLVKVRVVNPSGNTVDIAGYVTELREDGGIRLCQDDPERGQVHGLRPQNILAVERVHRA